MIWSTKYNDDFDTLLQNNNDTCSHHRNIQTLMVEIYKMNNNLNPLIMDFMFERRSYAYDLINFHEFVTKRKKPCKNGSWHFKLQISTVMVNFAWKRNTNELTSSV